MAQAEGQGYLNMPSNSNLDGTKTAKADARMTVHWNKRMEFNGKTANFYGGVQAVQENSNLALREPAGDHGPRGFLQGRAKGHAGRQDRKDPVRLRKLAQVFVLERIIDERTGKLIRQQKGEFRQLDVDNLDGLTSGSRAGLCRFLQQGQRRSQGPRPNPRQCRPSRPS